jgi:predicted nucleic acid-binding protein
MTLVVDASAVALTVQTSTEREAWVRELFREREILAPHILPAEVANFLRGAERRGELPAGIAALAYADVVAIEIELLPYGPFAERIWELRHNLTTYDAWYVAIAEALDAPLATLDRQLVRATGPRCRFVTPD